MARRLNTRLLVLVVIFVGVPMALVIFAAMKWGPFSGGDPKELFEDAKAYYERGAYAEAWIAIRQCSKDDPDVMHLMGDIALRQKPPAVIQAIEAWRRAIRLKPDHVEAQRKLAELYLAIRYWNEALAESKRLQALDPSFGRAYLWQARALVGLAEAEPIQSRKTPHLEAAAAACEAGLEQVPDQLELYRMLAMVYQQLDQPEQLDATIERALANNPQDADAYLLKSSRLASQDRTEEAVETLKKGLEVIGPSARLYVALGEMAVREPAIDDARKYFIGAIEADPADETGYLRLAGIYRVEDNREEAIQVLAQGLEVKPDSTVLMAQQADIYLEMGETEKADDLIQRIEQGTPLPGTVEFLKGKRALASQQIRQSISLLERARDLQPGPRARLLLGRALLLAGELGAAENELQVLVDQQPTLIPAWRMLAEVQLRLLKFDRTVRSARVVLEHQPADTETRLYLARARMLQGVPDEALAEANRAARTSPDSPDPLLLMAEVYERTNRKDDAEAAYRKAVEVAKTNVNVYQQFMQFYRRTGEDEKLKALVEEAKAAVSRDEFYVVLGTGEEVEKELTARVAAGEGGPPDMMALGELYLNTDRADKAKAMYQRALEAAEPQSSSWRQAWQRLFLLHLSDDEYEAASTMIQQLKGADPGAPELLFADPLLLLSQNKVEEATEALRKVTAANRSLSQGHFMLGQVLVGQGKWEEAMGALTRALEARPNLVPARLLLARIYLRQGNYGGVLSEANETIRFAPRLVSALELKATAHVGLGQWKEALATRLGIRDIVPDSVGNLIALAALYVQRHEPAEAEKVFQRAYDLAPDNALLVRSFADFYAETNRPQQGAEIVNAYVGRHLDSHEAYVIRAEFTAKVSGPEEAEADYRKAAELAPDSPDPLIFLGDQYSRQGRWDKAGEVYKMAVDRSKDSSLARKRLADVYMLQGKLDEAWATIEQVLKAHPDDAAALVVAGRIAARQDKGDEAKVLMQKALAMSPDYGEAKVRLAELYAGPEPMEALDILSGVDPSDKSFEKAQLLRADINTRRVQLREAILDLRRLLDFRPTSVIGRLQLASKYMVVEEYGRAAAILEELSKEKLDKEPSLLVALGDARVREKKFKEALATYEKARQVDPESAEALTGEVRALIALGRPKDALDRVHQVMNIYTDEVWPRMALVALYEQTNELQKAFETLRTGLLRNERWERGYVYLADLLVRANLPNDARQVLATGLSKVPESVPIRAGLAALEIGTSGPEAAAKILEPLAKEFESRYSRMPDRLPELRSYMPSVRIYSLSLYRMGKVDEALKWGMMLWSLDPTDVANANNMAWILATERKDKDFSRARDMIQRCMRLVPNHPQVLDTAGWIEFLDQRYDAAIENFLASIRYGETPEAHYHLGRVYEARRLPDEAREEYKKALDLGLGDRDRADAQNRIKQLSTAAG